MKNKIFIVILFFGVLFSCQKEDAPEITPEILPVVLNNKNKITSFQLNIAGKLISGVINQTNKIITLNTEDSDLTSLVPIIEYSDKSSISPVVNISQNFENEIVYTIIAENGASNIYRVIVNNISSNTDILNFKLLINAKKYEGTVDNDAKTLYVETDNTLETANIVFSIPDGASILPVKEGPQNFYLPVEYIVTAENGKTSTFTLTTKAFQFFDNHYKMFYSNATAIISGTGIDLSVPNSTLVLENEQNSYIIKNTSITNSSNYTNGMSFNTFRYSFPDNIATATNYKLKYLIDGNVKTVSTFNIDVLAEDIPIITSLNKNRYFSGDILIITGENLPNTISIPSNGSVFMISSSSSISYGFDLTVNNKKTELTVTLGYSYLFPSYFGNSEQEKTITLYGENRRVGTTINTIFK
ncbi:DUF5018 domain-containing protein [Tenacibaculum piscium]|uniref:DUF5018 domain-containing protein n=1 Tax=Tenacibaculum piscium TaxID=1458515 RepID=UPI001F3C855E|nr:DUF5018 domain-containing protein [Tenacibaculum piscium]